MNEKNERRWRDLEALVDWVESNLHDLRREMRYARRLLDEDKGPLPGTPSDPPEQGLKEAVAALEEAKDQTVYAINGVGAAGWPAPTEREGFRR